MKKIILSALVVALFLGYVVYTKTGAAPVTQKQVEQSVSSVPSESTNANSGGAVSPTQNNSVSTNISKASSGQYKDGVYTGPSVNVFYGDVQVKATIAGGKITDVVFLSYPNSRETSVQKSNMAMPILKQEAIVSQSSNVDVVSGASATSGGFKESLAGALAQAK